MTHHPGFRLLAACAIALALGSCDTAPSGDSGAFKSRYFAARTALEDGSYGRATRLYGKLMTEAGPLENRLRLEYAHALLRQGELARAAAEAQTLAAATQGAERAAALAVQGTAQHELARGGGTGASGLLRAAGAVIGTVLDTHPELDPLGALAMRRDEIAAALGG